MDANASRQQEYIENCAACRMGREPVRRQVFGKWMWLHDSVAACGATVIRERHKHEDAVAAQRAAVPED